MKKVALMFSLLAGIIGNAQTTYPESSDMVFNKKNELRIGTIRLLTGNSFDLGYERIIDRNQSFGANMLIGFGSNQDIAYTEQLFSISPYYRFYFNKSQEYGAKGMFVEGFADFYSGRTYNYFNNYTIDPYGNYYYYERKDDYFDVAAGFALGWKWVNTIGFVFEIKAGYGRNLMDENPNASGIFRGDFSVGYRF
ncbi:hypothetical protein MG290_01565 [Flavobacterium sp. CBA20B-1]|uniref:hypothetical protein n=1 Tax=unclassified Flavobacterium TaxID=196869 RepID=UPI0022257F93|nr:MULTISPECIES: hypothetical protein [unclassified Flavobacterium]WCM42383.1 hypothetical protein MG290_01565 [Flavobacterium sp. CBA20B-1]